MSATPIMKVLTLLLLYMIAVGAEQCIPGSFHMNFSAPATKDYATCKAWNNDTCCSANFTISLHKNSVRELYNFHWGHCKNISLECEKYLLAEECFYSCEPRLIHWLAHANNASVKGVPVCGDYCDAWYKACEMDQTCVADWQGGFNSTNKAYTCPRDSVCRTFKDVYGNGTNLCNVMWGKTFVYVDPKSCPCTRLDSPIPNDVTNMSMCSEAVSTTRPTLMPTSSGAFSKSVPTSVSTSVPTSVPTSVKTSVPTQRSTKMPTSSGSMLTSQLFAHLFFVVIVTTLKTTP